MTKNVILGSSNEGVELAIGQTVPGSIQEILSPEWKFIQIKVIGHRPSRLEAQDMNMGVYRYSDIVYMHNQ